MLYTDNKAIVTQYDYKYIHTYISIYITRHHYSQTKTISTQLAFPSCHSEFIYLLFL